MKRKIGELYNKPIVIGDKNEVTSNEIHINSLKSSNEGGGVVNLRESTTSQDLMGGIGSPI